MGLQCGRYDTWELNSYWVNEAIAVVAPIHPKLTTGLRGLLRKISAAPRRFDRGDVDFLHAHHGIRMRALLHRRRPPAPLSARAA